jgi:hypothetical protein
MWYRIVNDFSRRHLTFASDRLPAIAGIAAIFGDSLKDEYLWGLWKNDLHEGLVYHQLDYANTQSEPFQEPTWQDAPSWSWATLEQPVMWYHGWSDIRYKKLCKIDASDALKTKRLQLTGMLMERTKYTSGSCSFDNMHEKKNCITVRRVNIEPDHWFCNPYKEVFGTTALHKAVAIMPISGYLVSGNMDWNMACLLLYPQAELGHGVYRRVGVVLFYLDTKDELELHHVADFARSYQTSLEDRYFQQTNGDGEYTITLI